MNAKQRRDCLRKVRYSTRKKAINASMHYRDTVPLATPLSPYQCGTHFHLTKQEQRRKTA